MDAEHYICEHWLENKVYKNLQRPKHQRRFDQIAQRALAVAAETYADLGCAAGHSTFELAARVPGAWTGLDHSLSAVHVAREEFRDLDFEHVQNEHFTDMFDVVVCSEVIEHVHNDVAFAAFLRTITRKRLILTTPNRRVSDPGHLRVYTEQALRDLFEVVGWRVQIDRDGPFWYLTADWEES